jgi:hypothetical protein
MTCTPMRRQHTIMMYCISTILCGFSFFCGTAKAQPATPFPDRVRALLDSEWTELSITTALCTDYVVVYATAVRLKRETPKSTVYYSLPLGQAAAEKATVSEKDLKTLYTDTLAASKTIFEHRSQVEALNALPFEKAIEMIRSGAVKVGTDDVEMLSIRGKTAAGEVLLIEYGPFAPLDTTIQKLFHTKQMEMKQSEHKSILGLDPYAEE